MDFNIAPFETMIKAMAFKHSFALPMGNEKKDLEREGRIIVLELFGTGKLQYKSDPKLYTSSDFSFVKVVLEHRLINFKNFQKFGVKTSRVAVDEFDLVSFDAFSDDGERGFLETQESNVGMNGFVAPICPEIRSEIWHTCQKLIEKQGAAHAIRNLTGIRFKPNGNSYEFRIKIAGQSLSLGGFKTRAIAAKAKWGTLKLIQSMVEPIYLGAFAVNEKTLKKNHGEHRFHRLTKKREAISKDGQIPQFLYGDPLRALLILERLCLENTQDHTQLI